MSNGSICTVGELAREDCGGSPDQDAPPTDMDGSAHRPANGQTIAHDRKAKTMGSDNPTIKELAVNECWALLRTGEVGRLAVWVDDHPDIFPLNYAVDHGTLVFRSAGGTKISAALSDAPVALEVDGYISGSHEAWSVVIKGRAEGIREIGDVMDTVDLPLFPWQAGAKNFFVRIVPTLVTGRRFPVVDPAAWRTPFSNVRRSPSE